MEFRAFRKHIKPVSLQINPMAAQVGLEKKGLREGAIIGGVCAGLAAYFKVDTCLVRLIFVALTFLTGGAWIIAYVIMMIILPKIIIVTSIGFSIK